MLPRLDRFTHLWASSGLYFRMNSSFNCSSVMLLCAHSYMKFWNGLGFASFVSFVVLFWGLFFCGGGGHSRIWTEELPNQSPTIWTRFTVTFLTEAAKSGTFGTRWIIYSLLFIFSFCFVPVAIMFNVFVNVDTDCYLSSISVHWRNKLLILQAFVALHFGFGAPHVAISIWFSAIHRAN